MTAIKTTKLTKKFKDMTAVDGLDLVIEEGTLFSLLGVNGAGKTTTIKMLSCLTAPTSGDAVLLGKSVKDNPFAVKEFIGISPQETAIARNLTVCENLMMFAGIHGFDKAKAFEKCTALMNDFGLSEVSGKRAKLLSGGMQRRLSIASALIGEPRILFLDEPTLGLDVIARRELWDHIEALKSRMTIILTTHYMEEAEALSDSVGIMSKGKLVACGSPVDLVAQAGAKSFEDAFVSFARNGGKTI